VTAVSVSPINNMCMYMPLSILQYEQISSAFIIILMKKDYSTQYVTV